jgi:hypothetical protein
MMKTPRCSACSTNPLHVPGVLLVEKDDGTTTIERCDECAVHGSDEAARLALDKVDDELGGRSYVYAVKLSAIITLSCAPTAPTFKQAILENVLAWFDVVIGHDSPEGAFKGLGVEVKLEDVVQEGTS